MLTSDFDYNLPEELIAQTPMEPRDRSRLMVLDRDLKTIEHKQFFEITNYLSQGDLVVWNNSKVFKCFLSPFKEGVTLFISFVFQRHIFFKGIGLAKKIDCNRVIDYQVNRN